MRYIIFNDVISSGGAEIVMREIIHHLIHAGNKVLIISTNKAANYREDFTRIYGNKCKYISYYFGWHLKESQMIRNIMKKNLWNLFMLMNSLFLQDKLIVTKIENFPYEIMRFPWKEKYGWVHVDFNNLPNQEGLRKWLSSKLVLFDKVICVSNAAKKSVSQVICDSDNMIVAYNPINYIEIEANSKEKVEIYRDETKPLFVAVGRIAPEKNFLTLARVCSRLCREYDFEVWIVGDGEQRAELEEFLKQENCNCVKILGMQSNPHKYLVKADFLVSTSLGESYGLVIQEALVLDVPVLATRCPAIEECFDTKFGMLVDCDEAAIEQGLRYILEHPECVAEYKNVIKKEYDKTSLWEQRLRKIEDLLR